MDTGLDKLYADFGRLFVDCFEVDDAATVASVNQAGHRLGAYFVLVDHLVDGDVDPAQGAMEATRRVIGGFRHVTGVLGDPAVFWPCFDAAVDRWLSAFETELAFVSARRSLNSLDLSQMQTLARDRGCVAVGTPALLASRSPRKDRLHRLQLVASSIDAYSVAQQLRDDVLDWKEDLRARRPNFVLAALAAHADLERTSESDLVGLFHRRSIGLELLGEACDHTRSAAAQVAEVAPRWSRVVAAAAVQLGEALAFIEAMPKPFDRGGPQQVTVELDPARWGDERLVQGMRQLLAQWRHPRSLRHVMMFPATSGVSKPGVYVGDVFSRAMSVNCLLDLDAVSPGALGGLLDVEVGRLLARRDPGGDRLWRYFPGFDDLSPDLDTFAEVGAALLRTGRLGDDVRLTYRQTADRVVEAALRADTLETWIFSEEQRARSTELQAADLLWGRGQDLEVAANFLWFLLQLDRPRYREAVNALTETILGSAEAHDLRSTWYTDCGYVEFATARLLVQCDGSWDGLLRAIVERCQQRVLASYGAEQPVYGAAFYLLTCRLVVGTTAEAGVDRGLVETTWNRLADHCSAESAPAAEPFVHMDLGRTGRLDGELVFASDLLQRAFALRALAGTRSLLATHRRAGDTVDSHA